MTRLFNRYRWIFLLVTAAFTACRHDVQTHDYVSDNLRIDTLYRQGRQLITRDKPDSALHCFLQAQKLINPKTDIIQQIRIQSNLGLLYATNAQYTEALSYYNEALRLCQASNDSLRMAYSYNDIGKIHILKRDLSPDKTLDYFKKASAIYTRPNEYLLGDIYKNIGMYYHYTAQTDSALYYLMKSLRFPAYGSEMAIRYSLLGHTYMEQTPHLDSAKHYLQLSFDYPENTLRIKNACNNALYEIATQQQDTVQANRYAAIAVEYKNEVMSQENKLSAQALNIKETQKQELVRKNRHSNYLLAVTIIVCIGIFAFAYRQLQKYRRIRIKNRQIATQNRLLENTIAQKRRETILLKEELEDVNEQLLLKLETEEGRLLELRRQAWIARLREIDGKAVQYSIHSPKYKRYILEKYDELLHISDWERFSTLVDQEFNHLVSKIQNNYYERKNTRKNQSSIQFCVLRLLEVPQAIAEIVLNYNHPDSYRTREGDLKKRFHLTKEAGLQLFLLKLMQRIN